MVLKLGEFCLNSIAQNFNTTTNFDFTLLHSSAREKIIERLGNHNLLNYKNKFNEDIEDSPERESLYREKLVNNFFHSFLSQVKFDGCQQLDDSFLQLVAERGQNMTVRSIFINQCPKISDAGLQCFMTDISSNLEELTLNQIHVPLDTSLNEAIRSRQMIYIDLSFCSMVTDKNIWSLCKNTPTIKTLKLAHCKKVTNEGVRTALHMLNKLELLEIQGISCNGIEFFTDTSNAINTSSSINFKNMKRLIFCEKNGGSNPLGIKKLFKNCSKLRELTILYPSSLITPNYIKEINESPMIYLPMNLQSLSLYRSNISDGRIIVESLKRLDNLEKLSLNGISCLSDQILTQIFENNGCNLKEITLAGYLAIVPCQITDASTKSLAKNCKNLNKLNFELFSMNMNFNGLQNLFENINYAAKFEEINFSACRNLNSNILSQISMNCSNIKVLDLSGLNPLVTDEIIINVASCALHLTSLNIKACTKVTDTSICELSTKCLHMEYLVLAGINSLTDKTIFSIANHLQFSLKEIYLSGCSKISKASLCYLTDCCVNRLVCSHRCPNQNPNEIYAKNLDTGIFEKFF